MNGKTELPGTAALAERGDDVRLAIYSIILTVLVLSFGDALVKLISADFSLWQIYVLRSLLAVLVLAVLIKLPNRKGSFTPVSIRWAMLRSFLMAVVWVIYYAALPHVHLSVAAAVLYTFPLFITLFSALFTGDRVNWKSVVAVILGFAGVLVIVRPATADFTWYAILPLFSAVLFALTMLITRTKCRHENPKLLALMQNLISMALGIAASVVLLLWRPSDLVAANSFLFGGWMPLTSMHWLVLAAISATIVIGNIAGATAYQRGPSPVVATFDYTYLVFSALWGFLLFSEAPDIQSAAGMVMIVGAGILIVRQPRLN